MGVIKQLLLYFILHWILQLGHGRLYSEDWTRDWTVGLDSQKVVLIILKHQNTTKYLHDMNGIRGSRPWLDISRSAATLYRPTAQSGGKQERKCQPNLAPACIETFQEAAKWYTRVCYIAMTDMCSSKSSSDHGRIRTETKSSWFCMVGPRQAVYMVTAVLVHLTYLVSY